MEVSGWMRWLNKYVLGSAYWTIVLICSIVLGILWLPLPLIVVMLALALTGLYLLINKGIALLRCSWHVPRFKNIALHVFAVSMIVLAAPVFFLCYKSYFNNLYLPLVTLSNGEKTVKFQGMIHIGPSAFYTQVVSNLDEASRQGYTLFFEGVESTPARKQWAKRTILSNQDLDAFYNTGAELVGLYPQKAFFVKYKVLASKYPTNFVNADVSTQDIFKEYLRLWRTSPGFRAGMKIAESKKHASGVHAFRRVAEWQARGGPARHILSKRMFLGLYAIMQSRKQSINENPTGNQFGNTSVDELIVDFRDEMLVKRIIEDSSNKIYITYGVAHLPGVVAKLKKSDPRWKELNRENTKLLLPK